MGPIKQEEFKSIPAHLEVMKVWLVENKDKIQVVGQTTRPYKTKTRSGKLKQTSIETITIYYKEK